MQSYFVDNNASEGGAIFIQSADVALGNGTLLERNTAVGSSTTIRAYAAPASARAYAASASRGNSISSTNGTLRYILPAPLGTWVGTTREREVYAFGLVGSETISVMIMSGSLREYNPLDRKAPDKRLLLLPDFSIDEDFPFRCEAGFFRKTDTPEAQDGPQCEAVCPEGSHCPPGTVTPLPCSTGDGISSYCPEGSAFPVPCPKGTWTNSTGLTSALECSPCPLGHFCTGGPPTPCIEGSHSAHLGAIACELCPVGKAAGERGQANCTDCMAGTYVTRCGSNVHGTSFNCPFPQPTESLCYSSHHTQCPPGSTMQQCAPGEWRQLETGQCILASLGHYAPAGASMESSAQRLCTRM